MKSNEDEDNNSFVEFLVIVTIVIPWLMGVVLAKGYWVTFFSIVFPPYAWYLTTEYLMFGVGS